MSEEIRDQIVKAETTDQINEVTRLVKRVFIAVCSVLLVLTAGNAAGWAFYFKAETEGCFDRQARIEGTRAVWNAVFDELEELGVEDTTLDRLQVRIDEELPPITC